MITSGGKQLVEFSIQLLLEIDPLRPILLDKVRALDRCRKNFARPTGDFRTLTFDGARCADQGGGVWSARTSAR